MLRLSRDHAQAIHDHAVAETPKECVGVIVRHVRTHAPRLVRLVNAAPAPEERFEVTEKEIIKLYHALKKSEEYIDVIYHSHTRVEAIPSKHDVVNADVEDAHYVIVAPAARGRTLRSWRIAAGEAREEAVVLEND